MLAQLVGMARNPTVTPALIEQIKNPELLASRRMAYESALRNVAGDIVGDLQELTKSDAVPVRLSAVRVLPYRGRRVRGGDIEGVVKGRRSESAFLGRVRLGPIAGPRCGTAAEGSRDEQG